MKQDLWLRLSIVGLGAVLFLFLLFADKSNLNNESTVALTSESAAEVPVQPTLPPLSSDEQTDAWIAALAETPDPEGKAALLDSIIERLRERRRLAYAADYALQQAQLSDEPRVRLRAGRLNQQALDLDYVQADTALLRRYRDQAIRLLEPLVAEQPENETALLSLGLAYMRSQAPMQGIQSIRKVLEINPDNLEASYRLGEFSLQTGQFEKAIMRFEKVLSLEPDHYPAMFRLGIALAQAKQEAQAREYLETVVAEAEDPELKRSAQELLQQLP